MRRASQIPFGWVASGWIALGLTPLFACSPDARPMSTSTSTSIGMPSLDAPSVVAKAPGQVTGPDGISALPSATASTGPALPELVPSTNAPKYTLPLKRTPMLARPISGGTLRILSDGHTAVAADSDRDNVYVIDLGTGKLANTIALQPGDEPGRIVEDASGRVHVALRSGGAVATIDPVKATILARRALCAAPRGLAFDAKSGELHVACAGGELVSIDAAPTTSVVRRALMLNRDLRDVVVKGDKLVVSSFRSANVFVVTAAGATESTLHPPENASRMQASVAWRMIDGPGDQTIMLHERGQESPVGTFPGAYGSFNACQSGIVDSALSVIAVSPTDSATTIPSTPTLQGAIVGADIALSPDGTQLAVVSIAARDQGNAVQFFETNPSSSSSQGPIGLGGGCEPASAGPRAPTGGDANDLAPDALPAPVDYLAPSGEVVAIAYDKRGNVVVQTREPATLQILTQRKDPITLSTESRFDAGHQVFHTATKNRVACVSCHPEGGEDGRVWQFASLGLRRTQSLRGGIMNTAPFHWNGDQKDFGSLMADVFQGRMGGDVADMARVGALGAWVNQIPTIPTSEWSDAATVARGKDIFGSAGCGACHAGADFTNNLSADVGTGATFQVPQLHGLGFRAPYMHTGCATTLRARFSSECGGDQRHGNVAGLSEAQLGDLIAYLDTL
ncbi:MAG: putative cytochrome c peroxidase [Myxococcales bacterium]|nr:putative cytochrome c peroxidase [Myxococcales bacterium]